MFHLREKSVDFCKSKIITAQFRFERLKHNNVNDTMKVRLLLFMATFFFVYPYLILISVHKVLIIIYLYSLIIYFCLFNSHKSKPHGFN